MCITVYKNNYCLHYVGKEKTYHRQFKAFKNDH